MKPHLLIHLTVAAFAALAYPAACSAQGWSAAIEGGARAIGEMADDAAHLEGAKEMMRLQHQLEMERMERLHRMELQRIEAERQARNTQPVPRPSSPDVEQPPDAQKRLQIVEQAHPGWKAIVRHASFQNWLNNESPALRSMFNSTWEPSEIIMVISKFKRELRFNN